MNGEGPSPKYFVSAGNVDHTVPSPACDDVNIPYVCPTSTGTPRRSRYHAASACGSRHLKKTPPIPSTRSMILSLMTKGCSKLIECRLFETFPCGSRSVRQYGSGRLLMQRLTNCCRPSLSCSRRACDLC